jgi:hypothetical protein
MIKLLAPAIFISCLAGDLLGQSIPSAAAPIDPRHFTVMGITLGVSTFADVEKAFGVKQERRRCGSDALEDEGMCFVSRRNGVRVVFKSSFASFGGDLDGIVIGNRTEMGPCYNDCARVNLPGRPETVGGLRLGMAQKQVVALLGRPSSSEANIFYYGRTYEQPMTKNDLAKWLASENPPTKERIAKGDFKFEVVDDIQVFFDGSRTVIGFFVGHSRH